MLVTKVRLTLEDTADGLRATIEERGDGGSKAKSGGGEAFLVESVGAAKKRASRVARRHGLKQIAVVDRTG